MIKLMDKIKLESIIDQIKQSEYQNCCNCKYFPKIHNDINIVIEKWFWSVENVECIVFNCRYLRKRISQSIKPFKSNCCLCYKENTEI